MDNSEFLAHLDEGLDFTKRGEGATFAAHAARLHKAHRSMAEYHKAVHASLDDDHEMKAFHSAAHEFHQECSEAYKAISAGDVSVGDLHGPKACKASDIVPDGVRVAGTIPPHVKLVPRAGSNPGGDVTVDLSLEDMFSGV